MPQQVKNDKDYLKQYKGKLPRGKWISSPDDRPERKGQTLLTRSHDVIRRWAEERGGKPATVGGTEHDGHVGVLRFDFPRGGANRRLQKVSWDDWFATFDTRDLVFMYQEQLRNGDQSNFFRLNNPTREDA